MIIQNQIILCVYFADTTAKISKPSAHDEVWLVLLSTAMLCHIYIYLQYLQLFHVPYLMQGHCHGLGWVSSGVLYLVVIHFLARLKYFLIQCHGSCTNIYIVKSKNGNWYAVLQTLQQLLPRKEMQLCACKVINVYFVATKWWWFSVPTYLLI